MSYGEASTRSKKWETYSIIYRQVLPGEGIVGEGKTNPRQRSVQVTAVDEHDAIAMASRDFGIKPVNVVDVRRWSKPK